MGEVSSLGSASARPVKTAASPKPASGTSTPAVATPATRGVRRRPERAARWRVELGKLDDDRAVDDADRVRRDRLRRGQGYRPAGGQLEHRAVARADDAAAILVPVALAERAVVVRAAILDRVQLAGAVVDADEEAPLADDLRRAGRERIRRGHFDVRHYANSVPDRRSRRDPREAASPWPCAAPPSAS